MRNNHRIKLLTNGGNQARFQRTERVGGLVRWLTGKAFAADARELEFASSARYKVWQHTPTAPALGE